MAPPTKEKNRISEVADSDNESTGNSSDAPPPPRREKKKSKKSKKSKSGNMALDQLPVSGVTDTAEAPAGACGMAAGAT